GRAGWGSATPSARAASTPSRSAMSRAAIIEPRSGRRRRGGAGRGSPRSLLASPAVPHDLVRVPDRAEPELSADLVLQRLDLRGGELDDRAASEADHVLVMAAHERVLVEGCLVLEIEAGLPHQA